MDLVTASVLSPSDGEHRAPHARTLVNPALGLLAVAAMAGPPSDASSEGSAAAGVALQTVQAHVGRHEDLLDRFRRAPTPELRGQVLTMLEDVFARAAQEVFAFGRHRPGIAVEVDVALLLDTEAFIGHLGTGRVYLVRRGLVHQLTIDQGAAAPDAPAEDPGISRALGPEPRVRIESLCIETAAEDRFVLASGTTAIDAVQLHERLTGDHLSTLPEGLARDAGSTATAIVCAQLGSGDAVAAEGARSRLAALAPIPLFAHCDERELRAIAQATHPRRFPTDSIIFEQGDVGQELFLVVAGSVEIIKDGRAIATLGPGSNFGEMALLDEPQRSATVAAAEPAELLVISREAFFALLQSDAMLAVKILWNLTLRLSANLRRTSTRLAAVEREAAAHAMGKPAP